MRKTAILLCTLAVSACSTSDLESERQQRLVELGEDLFFDARLSSDGSSSCSSCHDPRLDFTDGKPVSVGVFGRAGTRNAPSLLDLQDVDRFFWDGRTEDRKEALLQSFTAPNELGNTSIDHVVRAVGERDQYRQKFTRIFGDQPIEEHFIAEAIDSYLRSLDRGTTRYDRAIAGTLSLSDDEKAGLSLFDGKAECAACHSLNTRNLTDNSVHHAGIGFERVSGRIDSILKRLNQHNETEASLGNLILSDNEVSELGHFVVSWNPAHIGAFRTPGLRNVANTAPYMHDGSIDSLEAAVERELYYRGITNGRPIALTVEERRQLLSFLRALSLEQKNSQ